MEPLTDKEKKFVAIALQFLAIREGADSRPIVESLVNKLECSEFMEGYIQFLKDWERYADALK